MYRDGRGVPQDQALAYAWLSLAAEATSERAETDDPRAARAELAGRLSAAELAAGQAQIDALRRLGAARLNGARRPAGPSSARSTARPRAPARRGSRRSWPRPPGARS